MLTGSTYQEIYENFRWDLPEVFNLGVALSDRYADGAGRPAIVFEDADSTIRRYTFDDLRALSNRFANALRAMGVERGARVAILLSQRPEVPIVHIACFKIGAVSLPLFTLFGPEALEHRLGDSEAEILVTDADNLGKISAIRSRLPRLRRVVVVDRGQADADSDFWGLVERASDALTPVATAITDPALLCYTSGTTGNPKGVLHAHGFMIGHRPSIAFTHNFFPQPGDLFWTPADWAWGGGLFDSLFASLDVGIPVLAHRFRKFDPEKAFSLLAQHQVRNSFMPPTALKMMREVASPKTRWPYAMRSIASGGEALGEEILDWGRSVFDLTFNEFWGQTEANLLVGNSMPVMPVKPGSMGRALPGHIVEVINAEGEVLSPGETGILAAKRPDPVFFLGYWRQPQATADKYVKDWLVTGDVGYKDEDGYLWFVGRDDDIISSGGYRIGPGEIENCIIQHPSVLMVAVVGSPDPVRGEIVKAFVVPRVGVEPTEEAAAEIQAHVKQRLAAYEYPREIEFVDALPMTTTGKILRGELRKLERERKLKPG